VKDDSRLIDLQDSWESRGNVGKGGVFSPVVYAVKQAENSYRADKTMTFGRDGKVVYANHVDPTDVAEPVMAGGARDVLATVYAWRMGGVDEVKKAAQVPMVSIKKLVTLQREAGVKTTLKLGNREYTAWKVVMRVIKDGKPGKDIWTVYVKDDANLVPLQIVAATKFGTFRASLAE
jgi:hypothetical protein